MTAIAQELSQSVGISQACQALGLPRSRLYPRQQAAGSSRSTPAHTLSTEERAEVPLPLPATADQRPVRRAGVAVGLVHQNDSAGRLRTDEQAQHDRTRAQ